MATIALDGGVLTRPAAGVSGLRMNDSTRDATDEVARGVYARMAQTVPAQECTREEAHLQIDLAV
jgi:hypothetical protein